MNRAPDAIRHPGRVVYDPRELWTETARPTKVTLRRRRSWSQRCDDARWAVEDALDAVADTCRRGSTSIDRIIFAVAILTSTLITARAAAYLIGRNF